MEPLPDQHNLFETLQAHYSLLQSLLASNAQTQARCEALTNLVFDWLAKDLPEAKALRPDIEDSIAQRAEALTQLADADLRATLERIVAARLAKAKSHSSLPPPREAAAQGPGQ